MTAEEVVIAFLHWYGPYALPVLLFTGGLGYFFTKHWRIFIELYKESKKEAFDSFDSYDVLKATLSYRKTKTHHTRVHLDPCRRVMLDDLMQIRYDVFLETMELVNTHSFYDVQPVTLHGALLSVIDAAVNEAERRSKEAGVPDIAVHLFCVPTYIYIQHFMTVVKAVCGDHGFESNRSRLRLLYLVLAEFIDEGSQEAEEAFANANEQLSGVTYKGYVCQ